LGASGAAGSAPVPGTSGAEGGGGAPQASTKSETETASDATRSLDMGRASELRLRRVESHRHRPRRPTIPERLRCEIKKKA
jgi:hypothetical protein